MYFADHSPPHFHAEYVGQEALIGVDTLATLAGELPPRALSLVRERASLHQGALRAAWAKASELKPVGRIEPLP